jgi:demethylmenaquinone methyltransferase/2-methoxy-6-polyprenyl-1,4-benzoquinol methylase
VQRGIEEMGRVLRPRGRLVILEITRPTRPPLSSFYSLWFDRLVPMLGRFASDGAAYSYLPASVRSFPDPDRLAAMIAGAGFDRVRWLLLAGGIIAIHSGTKRP